MGGTGVPLIPGVSHTRTCRGGRRCSAKHVTSRCRSSSLRIWNCTTARAVEPCTRSSVGSPVRRAETRRHATGCLDGTAGGNPHGRGMGYPLLAADHRCLSGPAARPAAPALGPTPGPGDGAAGHDRRWLGTGGTAASSLRPAGVALPDGARVDVVSEGECIEAGEPIGVIRVAGNRIVGCRMRTPNAQECVMSTSVFVNRAATALVVAGGLYGRTRFSP